jgi:2-iminobutanoate/2-iminopropanoate deaminase
MSGIKKVETKKAPAAIGPYSQGIMAGDLLFVSGQLAIDPQNGNIIDGNISQKTAKIINNIQAIAQAAGTDIDKTIKTTIYLTNLQDYPKVNESYAKYFNAPFPARVCVEVSSLPLGENIEIDAIISLL